MKNRFEAPYHDGKGWMLVSVQSPLGLVKLSRKLPLLQGRDQRRLRPNGAVSDSIIRRFGPSNPPGPATRRVRSPR